MPSKEVAVTVPADVPELAPTPASSVTAPCSLAEIRIKTRIVPQVLDDCTDGTSLLPVIGRSA